mmetsp:Transcript_100977/g.308788  ORF Transcript_100977/g.308788 Transcript_100977/m.308788 type:complete len:233 (+) Transcript_100977:188-886(+)
MAPFTSALLACAAFTAASTSFRRFLSASSTAARTAPPRFSKPNKRKAQRVVTAATSLGSRHRCHSGMARPKSALSGSMLRSTKSVVVAVPVPKAPHSSSPAACLHSLSNASSSSPSQSLARYDTRTSLAWTSAAAFKGPANKADRKCGRSTRINSCLRVSAAFKAVGAGNARLLNSYGEKTLASPGRNNHAKTLCPYLSKHMSRNSSCHSANMDFPTSTVSSIVLSIRIMTK